MTGQISDYNPKSNQLLHGFQKSQGQLRSQAKESNRKTNEETTTTLAVEPIKDSIAWLKLALIGQVDYRGSLEISVALLVKAPTKPDRWL